VNPYLRKWSAGRERSSARASKSIYLYRNYLVLPETGMSSKKDKNKAPMPASSAGLLRFFEDETQGIKIRPEYVVILAAALIIIAVILPIARA